MNLECTFQVGIWDKHTFIMQLLFYLYLTFRATKILSRGQSPGRSTRSIIWMNDDMVVTLPVQVGEDDPLRNPQVLVLESAG